MKDTDKAILSIIGGISIYFAVSNPRLIVVLLKARKGEGLPPSRVEMKNEA